MRSFVAADRRRARRPRPWTTFAAAALGIAVSCWVPDVRPLLAATPARTAVMRARAAATPAKASVVAPTPLAEVSPLLVCAIIKAEDRGFFFHRGFEPSQMLRGAAATLRGHGLRGGSTITQQLAKNLFLSADRTWQRKVEEALITVELERVLPKERTLELYLDVIEWGDGVWGAARAADAYFGKPTGALDGFESTFLASLVAAPRAPLTGDNGRRALALQKRVLYQLHLSGLLDETQWLSALERAHAVHGALRRGAPVAIALHAALPAPGVVPPLPLRREVAPLAPSEVLSSGCGLARELREAQRAFSRVEDGS